MRVCAYRIYSNRQDRRTDMELSVMQTQEILNWSLVALGAMLSGLMRAIWGMIKELQAEDKVMTEKLAAIQVLVAGDYVRNFDIVATRIFEKLDTIEHTIVVARIPDPQEKDNRWV